MNKLKITDLIETGYLSEINVHFGRFIAGLDNNNNPDIILAAALVSRATGDGDGYLDLNSMSRNPIPLGINGKKRLESPPLSQWLKTLRQSRVVGIAKAVVVDELRVIGVLIGVAV